MQTQTVRVSRACNQSCPHCTTCGPRSSDPSVSRAEVLAAVDRAISERVDRLVLGGGEPGLAPWLVECVQRCRRAGVRSVLASNGTLIDPALAARLAQAGLNEAQLTVHGFGHQADRLTLNAGGFSRLLTAMRELRKHGVQLTLVCPVTQSVLRHVPAVPDGVVHELGWDHGVSGILASVPLDVAPAERADYPHAAEAIVMLLERAGWLEIPVRLADGERMPPCAVEDPRARQRLFPEGPRGGSRGGVRLPVCDDCEHDEQCSGLPRDYVRTRPAHDVKPVQRATSGSALTIVQQRRRVTAALTRAGGGRRQIRISFHCDLACDHCSVETHLPPPAPEQVRAEISRAAAAGEVIALSGGEPTLSPHLLDYIALAADLSDEPVDLETNAGQLVERPGVEALVKAGLGSALVALPGSTAAVCDEITRTPGSFERTVAGVDQLHAAGVRVRLRYVVLDANVDDLPAFVELVARRWPGAAIVAELASATEASRHAPLRWDRLAALLDAKHAAERCRLELSLPPELADLPLCAAPGADAFGVTPRPPLQRRDTVKGGPCLSCRVARECPGVPRAHADAHGLRDLRPLNRHTASSRRSEGR